MMVKSDDSASIILYVCISYLTSAYMIQCLTVLSYTDVLCVCIVVEWARIWANQNNIW